MRRIMKLLSGAVVVAIMFCLTACTEIVGSSETPGSVETDEVVESSEEVETKMSFILMEELGEYGEEVILNKDTEFEEHEIVFHIPAGTYTVTNLNKSGGGQVTVYSGGPVLNGEWEEFVADENCARPIVVMAGNSQELEIMEGQFVVLSDGFENVEFVLE